MFNKWAVNGENIKTDGNGKNEESKREGKEVMNEEAKTKTVIAHVSNTGVNKILKGSKLTGDINVTCDLELSGDVEGNIKSVQDSNIVIKGTCKGNIETTGGSVDIDGELTGGNITAGKNVTISGAFKGGEVKAKGKIYVDGTFNGKLDGSEIEIGPHAQGKGEVLYKDYISISRGAKVEVHIAQVQEGLKAVKDSAEKKVVDMKPPAKEKDEKK